MIRWLEHIFEGETLSNLKLMNLEKGRLYGHLVVAFQYLKRAYRKDGLRLFIREYSDKTRDNERVGLDLMQEKNSS